MRRIPKVLTTKEAAEYFRVSTATIRRWCKTGQLPAFRIGREWRISVQELDRVVDDWTTRFPAGRRGVPTALRQRVESERPVEKEDSGYLASILVVDDDEAVRSLLQRVLTEAGHQVESCLRGQEAISKLPDGSFDLVITDLRMPGVDGLQILAKAKELIPSCEVIVVTGLAPTEVAADVVKRGAYACISKPLDIGHLLIVVDKALEKQRLTRVDRLTQLHDDRAFDELLEAEIARSERYRRPLSVLRIGLDHMELYGDSVGSPIGVTAVKEVASLLKRRVRKCDFVSVYGWGEFAIILAETNKTGAVSAAKRLGSLVEETSFEHKGILPHGSLTVSIGVAECPTDAREGVELAAKANHALLEAKWLGGNAVKTAGSLSGQLAGEI